MGKLSEALGLSSDSKGGEQQPPPPSFQEATGFSQAAAAAAPPPPQPGFSSAQAPTYACLLLASSDKLRTVNFPEHALTPIQDAIQRVWASGIQSQGYTTPANYEWKLSGRPWYGYGHEAIWSRRLVLHIIHGLAAAGWHVHVSCDLTKKQLDKDSIFFKSGPPLQRNMFSVSFNEGDKVRILDAPNEAILEAFKTVVAQSWSAGIQDARWKEENCWQIKLRGSPWHTSSGEQINAARLLLCNLFGVMDHHGYELIASVDQNVGSDNLGELDTLYFANKLPEGMRI